jgi:hypothetical protein
MPKKPQPSIYLKKSLLLSVKKEKCFTQSEMAWLCEELRKRGSNITYKVFVDLIKLEHICPQIFHAEVELITTYLKAKRTLVRKFNDQLKQFNPNVKPQ